MRIWSGLIALVLLLLLASGAAEAWLFLRTGSLEDLPPRMLALLAAACIAPAVGLLVWLLAGARSVTANLLLIVAALAGAASSAVVWLVVLSLDI
jgi:hypothetical protein